MLPPRRQQCLGRPSRSRDRGAGADVDKRACIGQTASHFRLHTRWTRLPCHHCPGGIDNLAQVVSADQGEWNLDPLTWGPSPSSSHTLFAHTPQDKRYLRISRDGEALDGRPSALEAARRRSLLCLLANKQTPRNVAMPQSGKAGCTLVGRRYRTHLQRLELSFEAHTYTTGQNEVCLLQHHESLRVNHSLGSIIYFTSSEAFESTRSPLLARLGRTIDRQTAFGLVPLARYAVARVLPTHQVASLPEVP